MMSLRDRFFLNLCERAGRKHIDLKPPFSFLIGSQLFVTLGGLYLDRIISEQATIMYNIIAKEHHTVRFLCVPKKTPEFCTIDVIDVIMHGIVCNRGACGHLSFDRILYTILASIRSTGNTNLSGGKSRK